MRSTFISADGRTWGEPILALAAILLDIFFGTNTIIMWFGWWLFVLGAMGIQSLTVASAFVFIYGDDVVKKHYPVIIERNKSHRTFVLGLCYSVFLFFWWKWSV